MSIRTRAALMDHVNAGHQVSYLMFWGHRKPASGVTNSCFSQWYEAPFSEAGTRYPTAEHFMMAEKARLFEDRQTEARIIAATNPGAAKKLGRGVSGFSEEVWNQHRFDIVVRGNLLKFGQHENLRQFLLNTDPSILVEASPVDRIWGIGLAADDPAADNPNCWKGLNLLGFALMEVRDRLRA